MTEKRSIPDLTLEQYMLGELPADEHAEVESLIRTDRNIEKAIQEIKLSTDSFLARFPPARAIAEINSQVIRSGLTPQTSRLRHKLLWILSPALAALFLVLILFRPWHRSSAIPDSFFTGSDSILIKGIPPSNLYKTQLLAYRLRNKQVKLLKSGETARVGDLLQLAYISAGKKYGMIFSIDGRKRVSLHFPETDSGSTRLVLNARIPLSKAIELDDAPYFERFFFVTADNPLDINSILQSATRFAATSMNPSQEQIRLLGGIEIHSIILNK